MANYSSLIKSTLAVPMGDMIASVAEGVASAQASLDEGSLAQMLEIYSEGGDEQIALMREIGYKPTFYTLPETTGELQIALRLGTTQATSGTPERPFPSVKKNTSSNRNTLMRAIKRVPARPARAKMYGTPVDAGYANRFGFSATTSAKLTFKIVPVPPPQGVEDLRVVPNIIGLSIDKAREALGVLDLDIVLPKLQGSASIPESTIVTTQTISAEMIVRIGSEIGVGV